MSAPSKASTHKLELLERSDSTAKQSIQPTQSLANGMERTIRLRR